MHESEILSPGSPSAWFAHALDCRQDRAFLTTRARLGTPPPGRLLQSPSSLTPSPPFPSQAGLRHFDLGVLQTIAFIGRPAQKQE